MRSPPDGRFVEDEGWHQAARRYATFLRRCESRRVLYWELGVGYNTPGIIKYPFWQMTCKNPRAVYACLNRSKAACPREIEDRSICINEDIRTVIQKLRE